MGTTEVLIKCLDKGYIRLVDRMGSDESIIRAARVSYAGDTKTGADPDADAKLLKYLWKHKHSTPFESCTITFEVQAPIFVFRQWHRHRTQSYNEMSARYAELDLGYYIPTPEVIGKQAKNTKQAREMTVPKEATERNIKTYRKFCDVAVAQYQLLLEEGWPRELARMVLPVSSYSRMYTTMNLLNCFRFLTLRMDPHAQYEIRVYAEAMLELIEPHFPVACGAFRETD